MTYKIRSVSLMKLQGKLAPYQTAKDYLATKGFTEMSCGDSQVPRYFIRGNVMFDTVLHTLKPHVKSDEWLALMKQRIDIDKKMEEIEYKQVKEEISDLLEDKIAYWETLL